MDTSAISRTSIAEAGARIAPHIRRTPTIAVDAADFGLPPAALSLKLELLQHSGSFKARGAFASLLLREVPPAGVVAASGGNHGAAVAFAAHKLGHKARIFVPTISSPSKIARIRELGAELVVEGDRYAQAFEHARAYAEASGAMLVHAYDQVPTLLGQGTVALELEQQAPELDSLLVAVGGGGLIGGIAAYAAGRMKVIGVEPELAPTLHAALQAGQPIDVPVSGLAADSLGASRIGTLALEIARRYVDRVALIEDDAIRNAQLLLWDRLRLVTEPGGAAALAALLVGAYRPSPGERVGVLICGGNTTAVNFAR
jgi:threonine dehydratase